LLTDQECADFPAALRSQTGVRFPSAPPQKKNQQSIVIAGFSLCINGFKAFCYSANVEYFMRSQKKKCSRRTENANEKC
jgi:hypothetical protein